MPERKDENPERVRLAEDERRERYWKRFGPYLSERQWGTVREDYSGDGSAWTYFPHDHAKSRAYRWGEDGLLGISDRQGRLCFALALWNGRDPFLKERLFGLTGPEGNHGEDVKECYYFLDSTPTHSYMRALYKYPQRAFPYAELVAENRKRTRQEPEYELTDTGIFSDDRYFDVQVEYAKAAPEDVLIRITITNRGPEEAQLHVLPTLWFRNTWSWGCTQEGCQVRPSLRGLDERTIETHEPALGSHRLSIAAIPEGCTPLFTDNVSNAELLWGAANESAYVKDAFHRHVVGGERDAVNPARRGTKSAFHLRLVLPARSERTLDLRLSAKSVARAEPFGRAFEAELRRLRGEADAWFAAEMPARLSDDERRIVRQAYAGLLWSKQFYHYVVDPWIAGDPAQPAPPQARREGRNRDWKHLYSRDVLSMPDTWEYPWFAAWDLAFHMLPFAKIDSAFAKQQLELLLREWYMHPNGQIPAYEWCFSDVNPPVHAWACWRVYKKSGPPGARDRRFLASCFQKLLLNFTWWVNRKDSAGKHLFSGGFLGLDNIGVFDRSQPLPTGGSLEQADGTAWMAFYCGTMLSIALELALEDPTYEDMASKFFEHFVAIVDAMNHLGGKGLWHETDGFYYDEIHHDGHSTPLRTRSMVGLLPLIAVEVLDVKTIERLPGFQKRMQWFLEHRPELARHISYMQDGARGHRLLAIPSRERLERVLRYMLDEREFLSPYGIRSLSRVHAEKPFVLHVDGVDHRVDYSPGESTTDLFGGNSNWRGPIWFPVNFLLIEALERYHHFYGDELQVELPTGSGRRATLHEVAVELARRLIALFTADEHGRRPCHGTERRYAEDPHWKDLVLFHEYFHADDGRGIGASHQTGWTALVATLIEATARLRSGERPDAAPVVPETPVAPVAKRPARAPKTRRRAKSARRPAQDRTGG